MLSLEKKDGKRLFISPDAILIAEQNEDGSAIWYQFTDQILAAALKTPFKDLAEFMNRAGQGHTLITLTRVETVKPMRLPAMAINGLNEISLLTGDGEKAVTQLAVKLGNRQFIYEVTESADAIMTMIEEKKAPMGVPGNPGDIIIPPAAPALRPSRKRPPAKRG